MSIFLGSNKGETITPDQVSPSVFVVGGAKKPSAAADIIFAGGGNDIVAGGGGNDIVSLGAGDDTFIWNGGDGNDIVSGDGGFDTLQFNGAALDEKIEIGSLLGATTIKGSVTIGGQKLSSTLLLNSIERITINSGAGNDTIDASKLGVGRSQLEVFAGDGNDKIIGSAGDDLIVGGRGDDVAYMGAGDDTFVWNPGEGSDTVEGGAGDGDALDFVGNGANENIDISAIGDRVRFFRDVANVTMDLHDVERIIFSSLGGTDNIHIGDLIGTGLDNVTIEMGATRDSLVGDGAKDVVTVDGTAQDDNIDVEFAGGVADVNLFYSFVNLLGIEAGDQIIVDGGTGHDSIAALNVQAGAPSLVLDGGAGNDVILGSRNADMLIGGDGDDIIDGNQGNDTAFLGAGDDLFVWDPGDGSDIVEGGDGFDRMLFNGANANEPVEISANGDRARFFRQPGNITMDLNDVEVVEFQALGGTDDITIRDLTGTDVQQIDISLAGEQFGTTPDGQVDTVTIEATNDQDFIDVFGSAESVAVLGAGPAFVNITHFDTTDRLTIKGGAGDDQISASSQAASMLMTLDAGAGDDTIFGSGGADLLIGGDGDDFIDGNRGDDVAFLGAGDDIFVWDPGDGSDIVEGGAGDDSMSFRGANVAENIDISANGDRVRFFRDVASITMDLNDVESTTFNAFGGVDTINIGDLTGTDLTRIELSLIGGSGTANDGVQDSITIAGTANTDAVSLSTDRLLTQIDGLHAQVQITGADAGLDRLQIDTGAGDDAVDASGLKADLFQFGVSLGDGNDVFIGSDGDDVVDGGDGFDILVGGDGDDTFLNGEIIQDFVAGAGSDDRIDLRALGVSFDWVMEHATDTDAGVLFDFNGEQMLLGGIEASSLHQDDFLLA